MFEIKIVMVFESWGENVKKKKKGRNYRKF